MKKQKIDKIIGFPEIEISLIRKRTHCKVMVGSHMEYLANLISKNAWSNIIFKGNYRSSANFDRTSFLIIDVDHGLTINEGIEMFKNYTHIIGTTRNHQKSKRGEPAYDRYRIVLMLRKHIFSATDYDATWTAFTQNKSCFNNGCKKLFSLWFKCNEIRSVNNNGWLVPVNQ
ncbi:MAG: hypothetical protein K8S87_01925 [Planctomycetes bacterium]|nr:hypothetical protein [Planctomycetota bacterium]